MIQRLNMFLGFILSLTNDIKYGFAFENFLKKLKKFLEAFRIRILHSCSFSELESQPLSFIISYIIPHVEIFSHILNFSFCVSLIVRFSHLLLY